MWEDGEDPVPSKGDTHAGRQHLTHHLALPPRIASYFSLTLDELFDWRPRLSEAEAAAVYASVYAEAAEDLPAAHARLMEVARERWSGWGLLVTLATLITSWAAG